MNHQTITDRLNDLYQQQQQKYRDHHDIRLEALVTKTDRQVTQAAA
jgi:hypothetical protein